MSRSDSTMRIIKAYISPKFEVAMLQDEDGRYLIRFKTYAGTEHSEYVTDFSSASYMFDIKLHELEGN